MKRQWEDEDIDLEDMPELEETSSANDDISGYSDKYFGPTGYGAEMEEEVNKRGYPLGAYDIFGVQGYGRKMESEVKKRKKANTPPPDFKQLGFNALQKENIHTGEHLRIESPYRIYPIREMSAEEKLKRKRELRRERYLKSKKKKENQVGGIRSRRRRRNLTIRSRKKRSTRRRRR
jgi:hypothetical protein